MAAGMQVLGLCLRQRGAATLGRIPLITSSQASAPSQVGDQSRGLTSKAFRDPAYKREAPFPYKEKKYNFWRAIFDDTTQRFDDNSKIIVVDGPPTGNKDKFARAIAEELDMHYIPAANLDSIYINDYGYDRRQMNDQFPFMTRSFEVHQFLQNPHHKLATKMQFEMMIVRFRQYQDAITHLLNTGQGVVMHRSIYSDIVFMETMAKLGYVTQTALEFYHESREQGMPEFLRPHLMIYLDIPVDKVLSNLAARQRPHEKDSPLHTREALTTMETIYKEKLLKPLNQHSELIVYDWSEEGDPEVVVEDLCRLDLDKYTHHDMRMGDWQFRDEWAWKSARIRFSSFKHEMENWLNVPKMPCPELILDGNDLYKFNKKLDEVPGNRYLFGFNKAMGDSVMFKLWPDKKDLR